MKKVNVKNCTMESVPENTSDFEITNCVFEGPPPKPFVSWNMYFEWSIENKYFTGIKISSFVGQVS